MRSPYRNALWLSGLVLALLLLVEFAAVLFLNGGTFVFTLDDPYIHLALAENILHGHYGVNGTEVSAPSSSILWPFLIAPLSQSPLAVLVLNGLCAAGTLYAVWRLLRPRRDESVEAPGAVAGALGGLLVAFIFIANLVGLTFLGMEHTLQVFLSVVIVLGLAAETRTQHVHWGLTGALVVAPLVRYECLALSVPALVYLFARGHRRTAVTTGILMAGGVVGFSGFLSALGLGVMPTSVLCKSDVVASEGRLLSLVSRVRGNVGSMEGMRLLFGLAILLYVVQKSARSRAERLFAGCISAAVVLHLCFGRRDWYHRYEVYVWASEVAALLYLFRHRIYRIAGAVGTYSFAFGALALAYFVCTPYVYAHLTLPVAANNIYEQHYQMHRLATEHLDADVAVNDLGYVSYGNDHYVLDLWGLASREALRRRQSSDTGQWMDDLTRARDIDYAMVYDEWFSERPDGWHKVGELHLSRERITPAHATVSVYATHCDARAPLHTALQSFSDTIPERVGLDIMPPSDSCRATP